MRSRQLPALYLTIFFAFLGYSLLITILTPMFLHPVESKFLQHLSNSTRMIYLGSLVGLYPLAQFFSVPVLGAFSDKFGRRIILCLSTLLVAVGYVAIGWSLQKVDLPLLYLAVAFCGLFEGIIAVSQGAITDLIAPEQRGQYFGYIYLSISLAFAIGPIGGGLLAHKLGSAFPFLLVGILIFIMGLWMIFYLKESNLNPDPNISYSQAFANLSGLWKKSNLRKFFTLNTLIYIAVFGFFNCYPIYLVAHFHMGVLEESLFISYVSLPVVLTNAGLIAWLDKRYSIKSIYICAIAILALGLLMIILPVAKPFLWLSLFVSGLGAALCLPYSVALISSQTIAEKQGRVLGNNQALQAGMEAFTGFAGGLLAAIWLPLPIFLFAIVAIIGSLYLRGIFARIK